jgi:CheY-like chemotaxis protein
MRSKQARAAGWFSGDDHDARNDAAAPFDTFGPIGDLRQRATHAPAPHGPHDIPRILVAESDAYHRRVLRVLLASPDLSTIEVEDGQSAVDLLSLRSFDVILLGIDLPTMSGPDVLRWVRRSRTPWCDIPIIGLIDAAHREQVGRLISHGMTDWTPKPVSRHDLTDKLVNFLPGLAGIGF